MIDLESSLKERIEQTLVNLLGADATFGFLFRKQNEGDKPQRPYAAIVANPEKPAGFGISIYRSVVDIELYFDAKQSGQTELDIDRASRYVEDKLDYIANNVTEFRLLRAGISQSFESETVRKRTIGCIVIAA